MKMLRELGQWVEYHGQAGEREVGRVKSSNHKWVFVVYHCDGDWDNFQNYTAAATNPDDLIIIERPKEQKSG